MQNFKAKSTILGISDFHMTHTMQAKQVQLLLQQLTVHHPAAFKRNYLFYSFIKTKGLWDERRDFMVWLIALSIFIPCSLLLQALIQRHYASLSNFQSQSYSILSISLIFMLIMPLLIKQIKHSSNSLYQLLQHNPIKLTAIILLQGINIAFLEYTFILWLLFILSVSYGFVSFYKENLFRESSLDTDYYQLQQVRRICFWAYKQAFIIKFKMRWLEKDPQRYQSLKQQVERYADLHTQLFNVEHQYCKRIKYIDLDRYLDEKL